MFARGFNNTNLVCNKRALLTNNPYENSHCLLWNAKKNMRKHTENKYHLIPLTSCFC